MRLFLLGTTDGVALVEGLLRQLNESRVDDPYEISIPEKLLTQDFLVSYRARPIDVLFLIDYDAHVSHLLSRDVPIPERVRVTAQDIVLAIELTRHASRRVDVSTASNNSLSEFLANALGSPAPSESAELKQLREADFDVAGLTPPMARYIEALYASLAGRKHLELVWPGELFLDGDNPGNALPATIEIAGNARCVAYGPYLPLPRGRWQATAVFGFSPDIGHMPFMFESDIAGEIVRGFFEVERGGFFKLELDFLVLHAMLPVEFRLITQDSALQGLVSLVEVKLTSPW